MEARRESRTEDRGRTTEGGRRWLAALGGDCHSRTARGDCHAARPTGGFGHGAAGGGAGGEPDNAVWGENYPREYESYLKTRIADTQTKFGGAYARDYLEADPYKVILY